jgi:hypothetical protein
VPDPHDIDRTLAPRIDASILAALTASERAQAVVYVDRKLREPGAVRVGESTVNITARGALAFVDQHPGANWMHPCRYLLVDVASGDRQSVDASHPPAFGKLESSWRIAWRASGIEDWQVLPISDQAQKGLPR